VTAKRLIGALFLSLFVSGMFTLWLSRRVGKNSHPAPSPKRLYVSASRDLNVGEVLNPTSLQLTDWPAAAAVNGSFLKIDQVAGRAVLYPLAKGELILDRHLAASGSGVGLTANIPPGMRAISVRSDEVVGVAGFLLPGTHVDVLVTYHAQNDPEAQTAMVLEDVSVLAAGQQIHPDPEGKPSSVNVVTLLLKPKDAAKVALATSLGTIHFVLRNGSDRAQTTDLPVGLSQLIGIPSPAKQLPHPSIKPVQAQEKERRYEVETILGSKQVTNSF
jgi:pilus assembly protein CpaB